VNYKSFKPNDEVHLYLFNLDNNMQIFHD